MSSSFKNNWKNLNIGNIADLKLLPWHLDYLDDDLKTELASRNIKTGTFLDIGTGHGTQANALQSLGFNVTGTDINENFLGIAKSANSNVQYVYDDILKTNLAQKYDYVFDRGCFHTIHKKHMPLYADAVHFLVKDTFFLKVSSGNDWDMKVPQVDLNVVIKTFKNKFNIISVQESVFAKEKPVTKPKLVKCFFFVMQPIN